MTKILQLPDSWLCNKTHTPESVLQNIKDQSLIFYLILIDNAQNMNSSSLNYPICVCKGSMKSVSYFILLHDGCKTHMRLLSFKAAPGFSVSSHSVSFILTLSVFLITCMQVIRLCLVYITKCNTIQECSFTAIIRRSFSSKCPLNAKHMLYLLVMELFFFCQEAYLRNWCIYLDVKNTSSLKSSLCACAWVWKRSQSYLNLKVMQPDLFSDGDWIWDTVWLLKELGLFLAAMD